jgi:FecR protein
MEVYDAQKERSMKGPHKDDYLWDGTGEPDPEIQRLETVLAKFRHAGEAPNFLHASKSVSARGSWGSRVWRLDVPRPRLALAAAGLAILAIALVEFFYVRPLKQRSDPSVRWNIAQFAGAPRVGSKNVSQTGELARLRVGETLETDGESRATITADTFGEISIEPNTRLRLLRTVPGRQHLALERGTIHATIWARPGDFAVETPSAQAIDLGCVYTLHVDDSGAGLLRTTIGWVGFKLADHESFIPAGAVCATRPKIGPGTPYFEDASEAFRAALARFDFGSLIAEQRGAELKAILREARREDALTLWHLLARVDEAERGRLYARLAGFVAPPPGVTPEGIARLDPQMLDAWWSALGYGDISLWRTWERSWSEGERGQK